MIVQILKELRLEPFTVKLNHRRLLDAMLAVAGVPPQKFRCAPPAPCSGTASPGWQKSSRPAESQAGDKSDVWMEGSTLKAPAPQQQGGVSEK